MEHYLYHIQEPTEGFFRDRGSKFFAFAYPIHEANDVNEILNLLKKKYYDARHHCYAYRLGIQGEIEFSADDQEPVHSAGPPILAAIKAKDLTDILVVVVRYFGGTKLGIRGLIEAYRTATEDALGGAELIQQIPKVIFEVRYPYEQTSEINRIFHRFELEILDASYTDSCLQTLAIEEKYYSQLYQQLVDARLNVKTLEIPDY